MMEPNERILTRISGQELERRWSAVRRQMHDRGIDALVMQSANDWLTLRHRKAWRRNGRAE